VWLCQNLIQLWGLAVVDIDNEEVVVVVVVGVVVVVVVVVDVVVVIVIGEDLVEIINCRSNLC